jgi:hypothetical protein
MVNQPRNPVVFVGSALSVWAIGTVAGAVAGGFTTYLVVLLLAFYVDKHSASLLLEPYLAAFIILSSAIPGAVAGFLGGLSAWFSDGVRKATTLGAVAGIFLSTPITVALWYWLMTSIAFSVD